MPEKNNKTKNDDILRIDIEDLAKEPEVLRITEDELPIVKPAENIDISERDMALLDARILVISGSDLAMVDRSILRLTEMDLTQAERNLLRITLEDLPQIVNRDMKNLPTTLDNSSSECYHGTSREAAEKICQEGFRVGSGAGYGEGIYFSVGGISIARSYMKGTPCIVRTRVNWGNIAYQDDQSTMKRIREKGGNFTEEALRLGYNSSLLKKQYSDTNPTIGIVLERIGKTVPTTRIQVIELIDPNNHFKKGK